MDEVKITCKYCHSEVGEEYIINQYGDYFCKDDCYENYYNQDIPEVMNLQSDKDHPYIDDYLAIRRHYLGWRLWREKLAKKIEYVWLEANEMIKDLEQVLEPFMDYFYREGDDGVFAWEIYQYVVKLQKIQSDILHWYPENRTFYYGFYFDSENFYGQAIEQKLEEGLEKAKDNITFNLSSGKHHPFSEEPNCVFENEPERQDVLNRLKNTLAENEMKAVLYDAYLCDGECGDYLDQSDDHYWFDGWFACESCAEDYKYVGTYDREELKKEIKYYEENPEALSRGTNYEYWDRYTAKVRRSCVLCKIEILEWRSSEPGTCVGV